MCKNSLFIGITLLFSIVFTAQAQDIVVGAERTNEYFPIIKNKRIAIVANHTSTIGNQHLVDTLLSSGFDIKRVFAPEHGFRGLADAGEHIKNSIDKKSGLPIISLYGNDKKPQKQHLQDIDIVIFDIQDVGVRFYTYISTMHYVMEACAEQNITLLILDRPNPNGHYIDGPVLDLKHRSFVGMQPIPIVQGLTVAELAKMNNGEKWTSTPCKLQIVKCENYTHKKMYDLPQAPSPNLPNMQSVYLYPSLGLFEGTVMSVGRGTNLPFQIYGHPEYSEKNFSFIPLPTPGASDPKHRGTVCYGQSLNSLLESNTGIPGIRLDFIIDAYNKTKSKEPFFKSFFTLLAGTPELQRAIEEGQSPNQIINSWQSDISKYKEMRKKYLLYDDFE